MTGEEGVEPPWYSGNLYKISLAMIICLLWLSGWKWGMIYEKNQENRQNLDTERSRPPAGAIFMKTC